MRDLSTFIWFSSNMSLSKIGRQRRGLKQTPWIIDNILDKTGERKQRPQTLDVLKHLHRLSDGSVVREVSDGQVYITAIFSNVAVRACLEEHDGCTPPEWDRALLLVTQYSIEFQHKNMLNECEYVLHIESFKIWDLQESFQRKKRLFFCMEDFQVRETAKHHWEEIRKQEMEANSVGINTADNSVSLTQLLDEMARDDSQMMVDTGGDLTASEKGVNSRGFQFPSLDRKFDLREFIISEADAEILDSISEWKNDYCPPIHEDKTSLESTPNITRNHTLRGEVSSEETKTVQHKSKGNVSLKEASTGVNSRGFQFPSLDRKFDLREFIISEADAEILDSISEWKNDYCPPIHEDKTSLESTPNITRNHTLGGEVSSEETKTVQHRSKGNVSLKEANTDDEDMESIHLSCSDPAEERKTGEPVSCEAGQMNGTNNKERTPTKGREFLDLNCSYTEDRDFKEKNKKLNSAVSIYPESQPFIPRLSPVEQKSKDSVDKQKNNEIESVSLKSSDSALTSTQPFEPILSPVSSLEVIYEDVSVQQNMARRNIFGEGIQARKKCSPSLAGDEDNLMAKDLHSKMSLSPVRFVSETPARKKRKVENLCCKEIENSDASVEDSVICERMDCRIQNSPHSSDVDTECTKIKTCTLDKGKNYTGNSVSSEDVVMATENSYSPDSSVPNNSGNENKFGKKKAVFKWKNKNASQGSRSEDSPNESLEGLVLVSPGVWENDGKKEESFEQEHCPEQEQMPEQEQSSEPEQSSEQKQSLEQEQSPEQSPEQEQSSEPEQSSEQKQSPEQEQSPEKEQSPVLPDQRLFGNEIILISSEESFAGIEEKNSSISRHAQSLKEANKESLPSKTVPRDSLCKHLNEQTASKTVRCPTDNSQLIGRKYRKSEEPHGITRYSSSGSENDADISRMEENSHDTETTLQTKKKMLDSLEEFDEEDKLNIHFPASLLCQMMDYFTNIDSSDGQ